MGTRSRTRSGGRVCIGFSFPLERHRDDSRKRQLSTWIVRSPRRRLVTASTIGVLASGPLATFATWQGERVSRGCFGFLTGLQVAEAALSKGQLDRERWTRPLAGQVDAYEMDRHGFVVAYSTSTGTLRPLTDVKSADWGQRLQDALAASPERILLQLRSVFLPDGFPDSVGPSYLRYSLWRGAQNIVSAMTAVLSTHALLAAVGLSSTPVAAATSWVLKDGIGQLGKLLTARRGREFDADPKRYRLSSDLLYDAGLSLEILTPLFPQYFLALAALGNFTKSVAITVGMACRNSVLSSFVLRGNLGDISAKNDAQNVVTNLTGMGLGILTARVLPPQPAIRLGAFAALTALYSVLNYKSMKAVRLNVLNRQRGAILADSFVRSDAQDVLDVDTVNDLECIVPFIPEHFQHLPLRLGVSLAQVGRLPPVRQRTNARYVMTLAEREIRVALHERASPRDLIQVLLQSAYLRYAIGVKQGGGMARCSPRGVRTAIGLPRSCLPSSVGRDIDRERLVTQAEAYAEAHADAFYRALEQRGWNTRVLQLAPERYRCRW